MLITAHRIGYNESSEGRDQWRAIDATTQEMLEGDFATATQEEIDLAVSKAANAFEHYRNMPAAARASFLREIANGVEALGDTLVQRMHQESALAEVRIRNERARTTGQLRIFADLITEGSWVDAVIDHSDVSRNPPRPDLRRMMHPIGPVVVFSVSNFPLAYSTAGGDTASALAAGCPVIVKAHEAHPGTNAMVADAIVKAAQKTGMPDGVFSTLYAQGFEVGKQLVTHPSVAAVGFTGSRKGGRALFDLAAAREVPIPVFAEMSSINPIFLLPGTVRLNAAHLAGQIASSVNTGAGQFCTRPGLLIALENEETSHFLSLLKKAFREVTPLTMLHSGIYENYVRSKTEFLTTPEVKKEHTQPDESSSAKAGPAIASVSAADFLSNENLQNEVFGPFTMLIKCNDLDEMMAIAKNLEGQLTSTLCGTDEELAHSEQLVDILRQRAGRLIFNGVPTGVEVCPAMVHGGPYPATTDSRFTAVGTSAIRRWVRPIVYQNCPQDLLPDALKDGNPLGIWRMVNGRIVNS